MITAAAERQRTLPLQTVVDRDGAGKPVLRILVEEAMRAGIEQVGIVVFPGDETTFSDSVAQHRRAVTFIPQLGGKGYGHAVACARPFASGEPVLHLVGDHLYVGRGEQGCGQLLVEVAEKENCAVSAVQPTRENDLPRFGTVAGAPVQGFTDLYTINTVAEKPTPTEAEQHLIVPGLRAGHYLCFFGMHVLTPAVFDILDGLLPRGESVTLSAALGELARQERYLAYVHPARRYDLGTKYGLLRAQLALALTGADRDLVLNQLLELLAQRDLDTPRQ